MIRIYWSWWEDPGKPWYILTGGGEAVWASVAAARPSPQHLPPPPFHEFAAAINDNFTINAINDKCTFSSNVIIVFVCCKSKLVVIDIKRRECSYVGIISFFQNYTRHFVVGVRRSRHLLDGVGLGRGGYRVLAGHHLYWGGG